MQLWTRPWCTTWGPLASLLSRYGFCDVWHFKHPDVKEYSCYYEMHKTLSRCYTSLECILTILLLDIALGPKQGILHWRMEASWLQEEYVKIKCN